MDNQATQELGKSKLVQAQWDKLVDGCRAVLRKAKGLPEEDVVVLPGDSAPGRYVRYALDKNGYLSTGKKHGRRRPHWNKKKLALKDLSIQLFRREFVLYEEAMRKAKGADWKGMEAADLSIVAARVAVILPGEFNARRTAARVAARNRHRVARRINYGLLASNADRRAHAA